MVSVSEELWNNLHAALTKSKYVGNYEIQIEKHNS